MFVLGMSCTVLSVTRSLQALRLYRKVNAEVAIIGGGRHVSHLLTGFLSPSVN